MNYDFFIDKELKLKMWFYKYTNNKGYKYEEKKKKYFIFNTSIVCQMTKKKFDIKEIITGIRDFEFIYILRWKEFNKKLLLS